LYYLGADHAAIDALLEIYLVNKNRKALALAKNVTDSWLKHMSPLGLIEESPYENDKRLKRILRNYSMTRKKISRLDSQTDFAVVLVKMYELTKEKRYLKAAERIIDGVLKHHKYGKGFAEFVDVENGNQSGSVIETKFLFLFLKILLLLHVSRREERIYKDRLLKDIIRDR